MNNLENYGVVELSALETKKECGGILPLLAVLAIDAFFMGTFYSVYTHKH